MNLRTRLKRLEQQHQVAQRPPLFIGYSFAEPAGWKSGDIVVMRRPGETEQALMDRVTREHGGNLYIQINKESEYEASPTTENQPTCSNS